jgi:hypothetical protein
MTPISLFLFLIGLSFQVNVVLAFELADAREKLRRVS